MSMKSLRTGFLSVRQKRARGGRGFRATVGLRAFTLRFAAASPAVTPAAARAVAQPSLIGGRSPVDGATDGRVDLRWTLPRGGAPDPGGEDGRDPERVRAAALERRRRSGDDGH